jgi:hypothetical protein
MELFGYKRHPLINELFKSNSFISRMKRKTYATWVTMVGGIRKEGKESEING